MSAGAPNRDATKQPDAPSRAALSRTRAQVIAVCSAVVTCAALFTAIYATMPEKSHVSETGLVAPPVAAFLSVPIAWAYAGAVIDRRDRRIGKRQ